MTLLAQRNSQLFSVQSVTSRANLMAAPPDSAPVPGAITEWLSKLAVLKGVPFGYLVPDEAMLPAESIRFFVLDPNWINALFEGATSIGRSSTRDAALDARLVAQLYAAVAPAGTVSGFVLRSNVVAGWPGIEVRAYDANHNRLTGVLRQDVLSPTVLLYMTTGQISYVDIGEPSEAMHFGVDIGQTSKSLRYVTVPAGAQPNTRPGDQVDKASVAVTYRSAGGGKRVLKIADLAKALETALVANNANLVPGTQQQRPFTPAEFALELVEGVQTVRFKNTTQEASA
ncbi:hypothetical protein [Pseudomonas huaxiensis]|uniref:hypothetical protein n=1 Tax=Pseudomonas huaxiensis TaxID=2213017 RepID=UPI000DA66266|nr:hypothetical protein [Pseudomonas huaxiensis]